LDKASRQKPQAYRDSNSGATCCQKRPVMDVNGLQFSGKSANMRVVCDPYISAGGGS
jgi:hypothetical protein